MVYQLPYLDKVKSIASIRQGDSGNENSRFETVLCSVQDISYLQKDTFYKVSFFEFIIAK